MALLAALVLGGCGGGGDGEPARSDAPNNDTPREVTGCPGLLSQCPPGSQPQLGAGVDLLCGDGPGTEILGGGRVLGVCQGTSASCVVVCNFNDPCDCGIDRIDEEGVTCLDCADASACGDGVCQGGESDVACPEDCGADCTPGQEQCAAGDRVLCNAQGRWERVACRADQSCERFAEVAICQTRISPSGGSIPEVGTVPDTGAGDPSAVRFRRAVLPCAQGASGCRALGFVGGGRAVLLDHGGALMTWDVASQALTDTGLRVGPIDAVSVARQRVVLPGRLPLIHDLEAGTQVSARSFVDDTIPLETGAVTISADGRRVAASMLMNGTPMAAVWDASTGAVLSLLRFVDPELPSLRPAHIVALDPSGRMLIEVRANSRDLDLLVVVWNVDEGRLIQLVRPHHGAGAGIAVVPGEPRFFIGDGLWDVTSGDYLWGVSARWSRVDVPPAIAPDGSVLAFGTGLVDAQSGRLLFRLPGQGRAWFDDSGGLLLLDGAERQAPTLYADTFAP